MEKQIKTRKPPTGTVQFSLFLPIDVHKALKIWAAIKDTTCQKLILESLEGFFADDKIHKEVARCNKRKS